jgi:predicted alpha/beta hydrolase
MELELPLEACPPMSESVPPHYVVGERAGPAAPVCLCLPAMGLAARYYRPFAEALAQALAGTVAVADLRGQGESNVSARRGARFGYREIVEEDLPALLDALAGRFPCRPLFVVGHSLGGQLATLAAVHRQDWLAGLVLLAAGTAHYRAWPSADRWRTRLAVSGIRAAAALLPWYPGSVLGFGGDQPRRLMRDWSTNAFSGKYRLAGSRIDYEARLAAVRLPVLALTIRDDPVAPPGAVSELLAKLPHAEQQRLEVDGMTSDRPWRRHFSWARRPDTVLDPIVRWIRAQERSIGARAAA